MEENEIRAGLESLTKEELIEVFPSLELKMADKKADLIETVMRLDPAPGEVEAFKKLLAPKAEPEPKPKFIVVHAIKENGIFYPPGSQYAGEKIERFLRDGQIREK
jgi:hypothetical protein